MFPDFIAADLNCSISTTIFPDSLKTDIKRFFQNDSRKKEESYRPVAPWRSG